MWFPITMMLLILIIPMWKFIKECRDERYVPPAYHDREERYYDRKEEKRLSKLVFKSPRSAFMYALKYMNVPIDVTSEGMIITYGLIEGKKGNTAIPFYNNVLVAGADGTVTSTLFVYESDQLTVKCGDFVLVGVMKLEEGIIAYVYGVLQVVLDLKLGFKEDKLRRK